MIFSGGGIGAEQMYFFDLDTGTEKVLHQDGTAYLYWKSDIYLWKRQDYTGFALHGMFQPRWYLGAENTSTDRPWTDMTWGVYLLMSVIEVGYEQMLIKDQTIGVWKFNFVSFMLY